MLRIHGFIMLTGTSAIVAGLVVARLSRSYRWWLKAHRMLQTAGVLSFLCGALLAGIGIAESGGAHLESMHALLGATGIFFALCIFFLGHAIFIAKRFARRLRFLHRWLGRAAVAQALCTLASGVFLSSFFSM